MRWGLRWPRDPSAGQPWKAAAPSSSTASASGAWASPARTGRPTRRWRRKRSRRLARRGNERRDKHRADARERALVKAISGGEACGLESPLAHERHRARAALGQRPHGRDRDALAPFGPTPHVALAVDGPAPERREPRTLQADAPCPGADRLAGRDLDVHEAAVSYERVV